MLPNAIASVWGPQQAGLLSWKTTPAMLTPSVLTGLLDKIPFLGRKQESPKPAVLADIKLKLFQAAEYLPDLFMVLESGSVIANTYKHLVPAPLRVVIATIATFNIVLVPVTVTSFFQGLIHLIRTLPGKNPVTLLIEMVNLVYLYGLSFAFTAVSSLGVRELLEKLSLPHNQLNMIGAAIFPWVGYLCRLSTITQLADIWAAQQVSFAVQKAFLNHSNHFTAGQCLQVLRDNKRFVKKACLGDKTVGKRLKSLESQLNSWNPAYRLYAQKKVRDLSLELKRKGELLSDNQVLGLGGNVCGFAAMLLAASTVVAAIFWMISSCSFLLQTHHDHKRTAQIQTQPAGYWHQAKTAAKLVSTKPILRRFLPGLV